MAGARCDSTAQAGSTAPGRGHRRRRLHRRGAGAPTRRRAAPRWSGSTPPRAAAADLEAAGAEPRRRRRHRPRRDRRRSRRRRAAVHAAAHRAATRDRWPSTSGSTSAAPRPCSTPRARPAPSAASTISSVVVYGYDDPAEQDETAHLRTCGIPYIDTKSGLDRLARRRGAVVVRPGDVYGPRSVPWALRPLELAKAGQLAVPGAGDGGCSRSTSTISSRRVVLGARARRARRGLHGLGRRARSASGSSSTGSPRSAAGGRRGGCRDPRSRRPARCVEGWARLRGRARRDLAAARRPSSTAAARCRPSSRAASSAGSRG